MVPRQRLEYQFGFPVADVLKAARADGTSLAIVGVDRRNESTVLRRGVEVRIESASPYRKSDGYFSSHSLSAFDAPNARGYVALDTVLVGGRRFELIDPPAAEDEDKSDDGNSASWPPDQPIFKARVRWLEEPEVTTSAAVLELSERLGPLTSRWLELVRSGKRERSPAQMEQVLTDLGKMPDAEYADDRAFWVAALVNPVPALGVCREIRPRLLTADESLERVRWAHEALRDSIARLETMPPGPFEVEPPPGVKW